MAEIYRLPAVSPTMEVGTLVAWRMEVGDAFEAGAVLAEVGTDKATMEAEVFDEGVLLARLVDEDAEIPVDAPIAVFGEEGEDASELIAQAREELDQRLSGVAAEGEEPPPATPEPEPSAVSEPEVSAPAAAPTRDIVRRWQGKPLATTFLEPPGDVGAIGSAPSPGRRGPVRASPAARKAAQEAGVDLSRVQGTGPHGRVTRADVEASGPQARGSAGAPAREDTRLKLSPMRKTIAKRLGEVHSTTPSFTLQVSLDMTAFVRMRARLKQAFPDDRISYNDLFMKAVAMALRAYPEANRSWDGTHMTQFGGVHMGMAVAVDEGLITPVIRDCDTRTIREIAAEARALAKKARDGALMPEDYQGNTFTVSNLGMFGIQRFTAILNPPASGILAVGALEQRPVVGEDGQLTVGWRMDVTMTCDHRVIDGAVAARFLQVLRAYVEEPGTMLA